MYTYTIVILPICEISVWHIPLLGVQWKTTDDEQRNCPKQVEFYSKNKFENLVHLFGFTWVISKVLHNVRFLFKNEFIVQNTFTAFNVISIVLYHSGPTFGQVLYSCQNAFVVDASDYSGHLIRHLLNASEAFPTEWFLQFWEQVKGWWAHVRTVRRVGKHLPSILFQNFRYCTWGMRPRVNVWYLVTARDLTPVSFLFHFKAPFCITGTTQPANTHTLFFTEVWLTAVAKIRTIASSCWPRKRSVQDFWNDLGILRIYHVAR